jgi:hypothetical protein
VGLLHDPLDAFSRGKRREEKMRQPSGVAAFVISLLLSACSPYVYKDEVRGFATGVDNLTAAYAASTAAVNDLTRSAQRDLWVSRRASLAMTIGCTPAASGPCAVHEVGQQVPAPTQTQTAAADAAVVFTALKDYASALAMIVNAEDRDALDKATGELQDSVTNLAKRFEPTPRPARSRSPPGLARLPDCSARSRQQVLISAASRLCARVSSVPIGICRRSRRRLRAR